SYHIAAVSVVIGCTERWVDNLLSRCGIDGVESAGRGITRRINQTGLLHVALTHRLATELDIPVARAVSLARQALLSGSHTVVVGAVIEFRIDVSGLERELENRMAEVAHTVQPRPRGRPRKSQ